MKKYFLLGFSLILVGGTAYAAKTEPMSNMIQEMIGKKEVVATDDMASLSTENLSLDEITTHKNSNDFSVLVNPSDVDNQKIEDHKEAIRKLTQRLVDTKFNEILSSFGNEQFGTIPQYDTNEGESFDRIGLTETYERLQKEGEKFFSAFFTAFPDSTQQEIEEHFNELIFVATYLEKWYDIKIGDESLWSIMYFNGEKLTTNNEWGIEQLLSFAEELKANNNEALLSKNVGATFTSTKVYSSFSNKSYSELIEWFVEQETGSTDYSAWFYDYFNGIVKIDTALIQKDNIGIWNRNKSFQENLPYLLAQKPESNLTLVESYRLLMMTSGNDKEEDVVNAIRTIKNQEAFFYRTYDHKEEVDASIGQLVFWGPNENLLGDNEDYGNQLLLPSENFQTHNGNGAIGGYEFITMQRNGYSTGTIAHELGHSMDRLLNAGSEFLTTYIDTGNRNTGAYINTYADGDKVSYRDNYAINSDVSQIKSKDDLITMTNNSENLIYAMDAVIADIVLEMPISEQVNYIRKAPIDVESGLRNDTEIQNTDASFDAVKLSESELKSLNIKGLDDLINHGLVIMEPDDNNSNLLGNHGQGYGTPLTYSSYFLPNGKFLNHSHRIINTILSKEGWEGFKAFNDSHGSNWKKGDATDISITALRTALNDSSLTYKSLTQEKYHENRETLGKKGLKTMTYTELKSTFEKSIDDFYEVKQNIYQSYISLTNSFKSDVFGYDTSLVTEVSNYEELYNAATSDPKARISIINDFSIPENSKEIAGFEGEIKGNGHKITNGEKSLFSNLTNATIESLILDNFIIEDQETHTGVLANQVSATTIRDVHVINSKVDIKQGSQYSAGSLVGEAKDSNIIQCSAQKNTIVGSYSGGIAGYAENSTIKDTYVYSGRITGNNGSDIRNGGLIGNFTSGTIKNTYSSATVDNGDGFIGSTYSYSNPSIDESNSLSIGNVEEDRMKFMGSDSNSKTYKNNYELDSSTGKSSANITQLDVKTISNENLQEDDFYKKQLGWDVENTWEIKHESKDELPYLRNSDPRNPDRLQVPLIFEWVEDINDRSTFIKGKLNDQAKITIYDEESIIAEAETLEDGSFSIPIEPLVGKHQVKIVAETDSLSIETHIEVKGTAPELKGKKNLTIDIGEYDFTPELFIENANDRYGEDNLKYDIDTSNVNLGFPGEYTVQVKATNPIGVSSSINVPVTLRDYNTIVFQGYFTQERFRLGLQSSNHKIRLVANTSISSVINSGSGKYIEISLYSQSGELKKQVSTNAEDLPETLVNGFDQTSYEDGDLLKVSYYQEKNKLQFYKGGEVELAFGDSGNEQLFQIKNDEITRITDDLIQTQNITKEVGDPVKAEDFVTKLNPDVASIPIDYTLKYTFNPGKTGEQINILQVSLGDFISKEIEVKLTYEYENNISLRGYRSEERLILGLNNLNHTINFVTDTSRDSILNDVEGRFVTVTVFSKDGKQKYQMSANGEDIPSDLTSSLNGKPYEEGDWIQIENMFDNKLQYYHNGEIKLDFDSCKKTELFRIQNDEIVHFDEKFVTTKPLTLEVGREARPEDFVAKVNEEIEGMPINYSLKQPFNPGKIGEQTNSLIVSMGDTITHEVPINLTYEYDNNLSIRCYMSEERFIMGLDERNRTFNFVTDTSFDSILDSNSGEYLKILVSASDGTEKYQLTANADSKPSEITPKLHGKGYKNGDHITVTHYYSGKLALYIDGQPQLDYGNSQSSEEFVIKNDQIVLYDPSEINTITQDVTIIVGQNVNPIDFVENPNEKYTYEFVTTPNTYKYGEQEIQVKVTDENGQSEIVEAKLVIKHESELTISTSGSLDERLTLKLNDQNHMLVGITDPKDTSVFSTNSESELLKVEIYDQSGERKKEEVLSGNTAPQAFMQALSKESMAVGDYLAITSQETNMQILYSAETKVHETNDETAYYVVDDQWKLEPMNAPTPPDPNPDEGDEYESATKVQSNAIVNFYKDTAPTLPVDPDDPSQPLDPLNPPNTIGGELMITYASVLDFGTQSKSSNEWFAKGDQLADGQKITPFVSIKDTRGSERKGWSLTAATDGQFVNNDTGKPLEGAELYYSNLYSGISGDSNAPEVRKGSILIDEQGVEIAKATETSGYNQNSIGLGKLQSNGETNGVKLSTPVNSLKDIGKYTTTVTYTLVADPTLGKG